MIGRLRWTRADGGLSGFMLGAAGMFATLYSTQAILPDLGEAFGVSASEAGLTISVIIVALAVGSWLWGPFSDRYGRRRAIVLASALLVLPTVAVALAPTFSALLACRALQGLCMPGLLTVGPPYVAETFSARGGGRAIGYYMMALIAGGLVGRVGVALVTAVAGWRWALGLLAVLPLAATVVMFRSLPEGPPPARSSTHLEGVLRQVRNGRLVAPTAVGCSLYFSFISIFSYAAFRLRGEPFDFGTAATGLVYLVWTLGVLGPPFGKMIDRSGWFPVAVGSLVASIGTFLLSLPEVLPLFVVSLGLFAAASFAGFAAAQVGVTQATSVDRGAATAVYFSAYYASGAVAGYLPGVIWQSAGWAGPALLCAGVIGLAVVVVVATGGWARARPETPG